MKNIIVNFETYNESIKSKIVQLSLAALSILSSCALSKSSYNDDYIYRHLKGKEIDSTNRKFTDSAKEALKTLIKNDERLLADLKPKIISRIDSIEFFTSPVLFSKMGVLAGYISLDTTISTPMDTKTTHQIIIDNKLLDTCSSFGDTNVIKTIIIHELNHALSDIYEIKNLTNHIDPNFRNITSLNDAQKIKVIWNKLSQLKSDSSGITNEMYLDLKKIYSNDYLGYIMTEDELYARVLNLKLWMMSQGRMRSLEERLKKEDMFYLSEQLRTSKQWIDKTDISDALLILDLNNLP